MNTFKQCAHIQTLLILSTLVVNLGGARRDRTSDPLLAKQVLSQLSYGPSCKEWWVWEDSNHRPHPYQGCALAT